MNPLPSKPLKIVSGGQTGADRAGLDWAIANGVAHGGWCPKGRRAEDGPIPEKYELKETPAANYRQRTEWNIRDSDGTVIFSIATVLTGGSKLTADIAKKQNKPWLHIAKTTKDPSQALLAFIQTNNIRVLNVAGPRASKEPEVREFLKMVLDGTALSEVGKVT